MFPAFEVGVTGKEDAPEDHPGRANAHDEKALSHAAASLGEQPPFSPSPVFWYQPTRSSGKTVPALGDEF